MRIYENHKSIKQEEWVEMWKSEIKKSTQKDWRKGQDIWKEKGFPKCKNWKVTMRIYENHKSIKQEEWVEMWKSEIERSTQKSRISGQETWKEKEFPKCRNWKVVKRIYGNHKCIKQGECSNKSKEEGLRRPGNKNNFWNGKKRKISSKKIILRSP